MSQSWDVKCLDCKSDMGMDANHAVDFMRLLVSNAKAIAGIADLMKGENSIVLDSCHGSVSVAWIAEHKDHRLVPVNEYGELDGECGGHVQCSHCGSWHHCVLPRDHDLSIPHSFKK